MFTLTVSRKHKNLLVLASKLVSFTCIDTRYVCSHNYEILINNDGYFYMGLIYTILFLFVVFLSWSINIHWHSIIIIVVIIIITIITVKKYYRSPVFLILKLICILIKSVFNNFNLSMVPRYSADRHSTVHMFW